MPVTLRKGPADMSLSLTPLIDVVFLLLIFFLVSARMEQEERDVAVNLPEASAAQPTIFKGQEVFVTVTAVGDYYVNGEQMNAVELEAMLTALYRTNPGRQRVLIRADKDSRTHQVVAVMNACNKANIQDYSIAAE